MTYLRIKCSRCGRMVAARRTRYGDYILRPHSASGKLADNQRDWTDDQREDVRSGYRDPLTDQIQRNCPGTGEIIAGRDAETE